MADDINSIEKEAHRFLNSQEYLEASKLFSQAADEYQKRGQHQQAALCFALAASCWTLKAGEKALFYHAAALYEKAAKQAEISGDFEYASTHYKHAGRNYERDLEYTAFSECFYRSKECYRKHVSSKLFPSKKNKSMAKVTYHYDSRQWLENLASWTSLTLSSLLWGHGERPRRTIFFACCLILVCAFLYTQGIFLKNGATFKPRLFEAIDFSAVTFTRFGTWDTLPLGINRRIATIEGFIGILSIPLFITGLCRKYLRFT